MISIYIFIVVLLLIGGGIWAWPIVAGILGLSGVTDKSSALNNIIQLMHAYDITPTEINVAFYAPASDSASTRHRRGDIIKALFSYLSAIFIFAGIGTYIVMFWNDMGSAMRIVVTLGTGYILLIVLISTLHKKKSSKIILPLTLASAFMMSNGWFVLIREVFPYGNNWRFVMLYVFGVMALHQCLLFSKYRLTVLMFTSIFFIYGFLHVGLDILGVPLVYIAMIIGASIFLVGTALEKTEYRLLVEPMLLIGSCLLNSVVFDRVALLTSTNWAILITGLSVMLTAYGLQCEGRYPRLTDLGYFIGSIMVYAGLFALVQDTYFEFFYLAITASGLYACVVLHSRALLLTTTIAMLSFLGYCSEEYFANSLGWPFTLICMGLIFMGISAVAIKIKHRI